MATTTPNFGWAVPTSTDLVKDGAVAIETLGDSIDASLVDLKGGTTGQVLAKASATDMDFTWVAQDDSNAIQNAIVDAKGDLIAATAADTPARLAVGTNNQVLTADSTTATGLKWATPASPTSGMNLISRTTFSNVASHAVDVCFTSTYDSYLIVIEGISAATLADDLQLQWRTGAGTTYSAATYYGAIRSVDYTTALTTTATVAANQYTLSATTYNSSILWVNGVGQTTEVPRWHGTSTEFQNAVEYYGGGMLTAGIAATGFLLKSASTNITGEVAVYGLAK
jgi:hypothetical protein